MAVRLKEELSVMQDGAKHKAQLSFMVGLKPLNLGRCINAVGLMLLLSLVWTWILTVGLEQQRNEWLVNHRDTATDTVCQEVLNKDNKMMSVQTDVCLVSFTENWYVPVLPTHCPISPGTVPICPEMEYLLW